MAVSIQIQTIDGIYILAFQMEPHTGKWVTHNNKIGYSRLLSRLMIVILWTFYHMFLQGSIVTLLETKKRSMKEIRVRANRLKTRTKHSTIPLVM